MVANGSVACKSCTRQGKTAKKEYGIAKHYDDTCIVYSMGSRNKFDFERRVRTLAPGCEIHVSLLYLRLHSSDKCNNRFSILLFQEK